jgi:integrase
MAKANIKNERIKYEYATYMGEAKRMSPDTVKDALASIALFEKTTKARDFSAFHIEQARRFKRFLSETRNARTGKPLSKATIHSRLNALKAFFLWLATQPGYKSKISYSDCEYFNPSAHDTRIATARKEVKVPSLEQIKHVLSVMPTETLFQQRDRAIIAFALLSGARDNAIASFNIGHVDLARRTVFHDAATVRTKGRKTFTSTFFPVGDEVEEIVQDWVHTLRGDCLFADSDPLFPATRIGLNERGEFAPDGFQRKHWSNADPIRKLFKVAFEAADLPYYNPHSFRNTLAQLGQRICRTPEEMKAWSQNLGHEEMMTTFTSYGKLDNHRQREILIRLAEGPNGEIDIQGEPSPDIINWVLNALKRRS